MSVLTYLASNYPLKEVQNDKVKTLSVNQALEFGIDVPDYVLEDSFDRNKPTLVVWEDNENDLGEISISPFFKVANENPYTNKNFIGYLYWEYTKIRAEILIQYIYSHLLYADEIELWRVWDGNGFEDDLSKLRKQYISIEHLTYIDLENVFNKLHFDFPECIIVSRNNEEH